MIIGLLYAFLYYTVKHRFFGFSISGWFKNLPLMLAVFAFLFSRPLSWMVAGLLLTVIIRLIYWRARRDGFIRFVIAGPQHVSQDVQAIENDRKVSLKATGSFSVKDWEDYVLQRPADFWRVPVGDHTIMVNHPSGRYLYQFIQPGMVEQIESGHLRFGRKPSEALAITFLTTWRPENEEVSFMFFAPNEDSGPAKLKRRVFLSFNNLEDKHAVWQSLLNIATQAT